MTFYEGFYLVLAALGMCASAGAAFWLFKTGMARQAASTWKDNADAQEKRAEEGERKIETLTLRVAALEADNAALRELVTARAEVTALAKAVQKNHALEMKAILNLSQQLLELTRGVKND